MLQAGHERRTARGLRKGQRQEQFTSWATKWKRGGENQRSEGRSHPLSLTQRPAKMEGETREDGILAEKGTHVHSWWEYRWICQYGKQELKLEEPCDPAIPAPGMCPTEMQSQPHKDICTPMSSAAGFTAARICKQPRWPPTGARRPTYAYATEYHSALTENILPSATVWMSPEQPRC